MFFSDKKLAKQSNIDEKHQVAFYSSDLSSQQLNKGIRIH